MIAGLGAKKYWASTRDVNYLITANEFWPWDIQWKANHMQVFLQNKKYENAKRYAENRLAAWPNDPESYLINALYYRSMNQFDEAIKFYKRSLATVENGNCYKPGYSSYNQMILDPRFPITINKIKEEDLQHCQY